MDWSFGDVLLTMLAFFFWFTFIWMFVGVFADIFRRSDLSGWGKAGWLFTICVLPFLGALIYMISRPVTDADFKVVADVPTVATPRPATYSPADEIAKLTQLHEGGALSDGEYQQLKSKVLA